MKEARRKKKVIADMMAIGEAFVGVMVMCIGVEHEIPLLAVLGIALLVFLAIEK